MPPGLPETKTEGVRDFRQTLSGATPEEKRAALEEVLQSTALLRSAQLQSFLRFVCEMEISGRSVEITEHLIGVEALGRAPDYSPAEDAVVRRRAGDLRDKLDEAYGSELAGARLRIDLPKGRYVPRFLRVDPVRAEMRPSELAGSRRAWSPVWLMIVSGVAGSLLTSAAFLAYQSWRAPHRPAEAGVTYEAESSHNTFGGAVAAEACSPQCSGGARVRRIGGNPLNALVFEGVTVGASGNYVVAVLYLLNGSRSFFVSVNDAAGFEVPLTGQSWSVPGVVRITLPLRAGLNKIKFYNERSFAPDLDAIVIR